MDEQQLQQKEVELKIKENELNARESDLIVRENRMNSGLEISINRQEFFRRAIEVGANSLNKLDDMTADVENESVLDHLEKLIDTAAVKLIEELNK